MTDQKEHCPNNAEFVMPWAGKLMNYCEVHTRGMRALAGAMGYPMEVRKLLGEHECMGANDLEEYKKAEEEANLCACANENPEHKQDPQFTKHTKYTCSNDKFGLSVG